MPPTVATATELDDSTRAEVRALADAVEQRDGAPPLSDQALTQLGSADVRHVLAREGGELTGYAQLGGGSMEVVGDAESGSALVRAIAPRPGMLIWSHGKRSPIAAVLESRGFTRRRILHQLRTPLESAPEPQPLADGVSVRAFRPGHDEQAWLRVNAAAFANHAEQGSWQLADLLAREAADWFDPEGFLLAERDGGLIGFHWTKVHPDGMGEVYVLGVDPTAQGLRLGAALLGRGLAHLFARGCREVLLYVDDDNAPAMRLYERAGFDRHDVDVQWGR